MQIKRRREKMQTSKDPRDASLSDVACNYLSFILKVLRRVLWTRIVRYRDRSIVHALPRWFVSFSWKN